MIETLSITYYIKLEDDPSKSDSALLSRCWSFWACLFHPLFRGGVYSQLTSPTDRDNVFDLSATQPLSVFLFNISAAQHTMHRML